MTTLDKARYSDGSANSTDLMREAFEESGYVEKGHASKLEWHENLETYDEAKNHQKNDSSRPAQVAIDEAKKKILEHALEDTGKAIAKRVVGEKAVEIAEWAMHPFAKALGGAARTAIAVVGAEAVVVGGMVVATAATVLSAAKTISDGDKMHDHQDTIGMDLAATHLLDLDMSYADSVRKHYDGNIAPDTVVRRFQNADGSLTPYGQQNMPKLHAACDAGSRAGLDALHASSPEEFLRQHPAIAQRREHDLAFAKGFDQVLFVAKRPDGAHRLDEIKRKIDERDPRSLAQVPVRA